MGKVLLVDDEDVFRFSLAQRLRLRGYDVVECADGSAALEAVRLAADFDVIFLDHRMPGMKGEEVLRQIKNLRPAIPVVMLTALGAEKSPGTWACLQKPCDLDALIQAIEGARTERSTRIPGGNDP